MTDQNYTLILAQVESLLSSESDQIANAANLSTLIYHNVGRINWVGFYFERDGELVLGPFAGQLACTRIQIGEGVCGTAYAKQEPLLIEDVHQFEGHIACDVASESEVVVPFKTSRLSGVLDIDSPEKARFGQAEKDFFEAIAKLYAAS